MTAMRWLPAGTGFRGILTFVRCPLGLPVGPSMFAMSARRARSALRAMAAVTAMHQHVQQQEHADEEYPGESRHCPAPL